MGGGPVRCRNGVCAHIPQCMGCQDRYSGTFTNCRQSIARQRWPGRTPPPGRSGVGPGARSGGCLIGHDIRAASRSGRLQPQCALLWSAGRSLIADLR